MDMGPYSTTQPLGESAVSGEVENPLIAGIPLQIRNRVSLQSVPRKT
jgi:hypothetical protein